MQSRHVKKSAKKTVKKAVLISLATLASPVFAQNSVTLYGIVDDSISYQSSQTSLGSNKGGRSNIKMLSGIWAGSRFGLKGSEDLGGGTKAIYRGNSSIGTPPPPTGSWKLAKKRQANGKTK